MYYKYRLQKKQVSTNNGQTWTDVSPLETRKGSTIGTYDTYSDCMSGSPEPVSPYYSQYLTTEALESGYIYLQLQDNVSTDDVVSVSYSKDSGQTWTTVDNINNQQVVAFATSLNAGDKVLWKGNARQYASVYSEDVTGEGLWSHIGGTTRFKVYGNIMSLIYGDNFLNKTQFPSGSSHNFENLFGGITELVDAENLILPATTLTEGCYYEMFYGCTNLTTVPSMLPATILARHCYRSMFYGCTGLTVAPVLPATTMAYGCYQQMFYRCTNLTTAPALPATVLADWCYAYMFGYCTNLTTASALPAMACTNYCYTYMFQGCTSLTTTPSILPATTLALQCYTYMFGGCTSLATAPELPATSLAKLSYWMMFKGCTNLNYIECLATNLSATDCTLDWVDGVAASGTFVKSSSMSSWGRGNSGIPTGWTVQNA